SPSNAAVVPRMPGFRNSKRLPSSARRFSTGVPDITRRCFALRRRAAFAASVSRVLMAWASSRITASNSSFERSAASRRRIPYVAITESCSPECGPGGRRSGPVWSRTWKQGVKRLASAFQVTTRALGEQPERSIAEDDRLFALPRRGKQLRKRHDLAVELESSLEIEPSDIGVDGERPFAGRAEELAVRGNLPPRGHQRTQRRGKALSCDPELASFGVHRSEPELDEAGASRRLGDRIAAHDRRRR